MKKLLKITLLFILSIFFIACSKQVYSNNIISDTSKLKPSPYKEGAHYYIKKGVDFKFYNKIIISDIPIIKDDVKDKSFDKELLIDVSTYFKNELDKELNSVVNKNLGNKSLSIEISVTSLNKEYKDLKFYQYIPIGLAITAIKRGVGGEDKNLVIAIALKITDTKTNELIAMGTDTDVKKGFKSNQKIKFEDLKPSIDTWVKRFKKRLQELVDNKNM